ncbi:MAG: hypothetical protein QXS20_09900 [Candidatus Thorarchaeota archaeon]
MQNPELVPYLAVPLIFSLMALTVIVRSWYRSRLLPALLYSIAVTCFFAMAVDLILDQTFMPFRDWRLEISDKTIWMSNLLLSVFVVGGFLCWYFAIIYSQFDTAPVRSYVVTALAGAALMGELMEESWSAPTVSALEAVAFAILIVEILVYGRTVLGSELTSVQRRYARLYFLGFLVWIVAGPLGVVLESVEGLEWLSGTWVLPYSLGLFLVSVAVASDPRLLSISAARPYDMIVLDQQGVLIFLHRFREQASGLDPELVGSAMSGILSLMKELLASSKQLHRIDHGDAKILVETGPLTTFLLVVNKETVRFRQILRQLQLEFESNFRESLISGAPMVSEYAAFRRRVVELIS